MFLEHVLPEDRAMVDGKFRQAMENQSDWNFECRIRRADGQVRWISAAGRHTQDAAGAPRRMAGIVQDITERKRAEEALQQRTLELQHLTETLEERVKERTAELANLSSELLVAQEKERRRISYDLHDNVWQTLEIIKTQIGASLLQGRRSGLAGVSSKGKTTHPCHSGYDCKSPFDAGRSVAIGS